MGYWIGKHNIKVSKSATIILIYELWYSDSVITNETIFNPFKYSWINNSLDGSEDDQFRRYEDIKRKWSY